MNRPRLLQLAAACAAIALAALSTGCQRIVPVRTLPNWVRGVYIPMVVNKTYEPGLEERATQLIQEAFLFDGRLDVVARDEADVFVIVELTSWAEEVTDTTGDKVASDFQVTLGADVALFEPFEDEEPLARLESIEIVREINRDTRSTGFDPEPDARERILNDLANAVVYRTLSGFPIVTEDVEQ